MKPKVSKSNAPLPQTSGLECLLRAYAVRYSRLRLVHGIGLAGTLLLLPLPAVCLLDRFTRLTETSRVAGWTVYVLAAAGLSGWFVIRRLLQRPSALDVAFAVGDQLPHSHQSLAAAVQFSGDPKRAEAGVSKELLDAVRAVAQADAARVELALLLPARNAARAMGWAAVLVALQIALLCAPELGYAGLLLRFFNPFGNYARVSGVEVKVTPGSVDAGDGETITVEAEAGAPELERLGLYRGASGTETQRFEMTRIQPGHFRFTLPNLRRDLTYFLGENLIQTELFHVRVRRRPRLEAFAFRIEFPAYTGLAPREEQQAGGNLTALSGAQVRLSVAADTDCARFVLRRMEAEDVLRDLEMEQDGQGGSLSFALRETFRYQIVAFSRELGLENEDRLTYTVRAEPDRPPEVTIAEPGDRVCLDAAQQLRVRFTVRDEFPVRAVRLSVWRAGDPPRTRSVDAEGLGTPSLTGTGTLSLPEWNVEPGEELHYAVEAQDALAQWGRSSEHRIEIPVAAGDAEALRLAKIIEPARKGQAEAKAQLEKAYTAFLQMHGLLAARPLKWTPALEKAAEPLRPALEELRQQTAHAAGLLLQQSEAAGEDEAAEDLRQLAGLANALDLAVKRIELEQALVEIREDFKGAGTQRAEEIVRLLGNWREPTAAGERFLTLYERLLRVRDLARRGDQLARAQQAVLVQAHGRRENNDARLRIRQRLLIESLTALYADAQNAAKIGAGDSSLPAALDWSALKKASDEIRDVARAAAGFPVERLMKFEPQVQATARQMESWLEAHEAAAMVGRAALAAAREGMQAVGVQLRVVAVALASLAQTLAEDPLDKEDERIVLPPAIAGLRRLLNVFDHLVEGLWQRGNAQDQARGRGDMARLARVLLAIRHGSLAAAARQAELLVASFAREDTLATPLLPPLRAALKHTAQGLASAIGQAEAFDGERELWELSARAERLAARQRGAPSAMRIRLDLPALAKTAAQCAKDAQARGEAAASKTLAAGAGILGNRFDPAQRLPLSLVQGWDEFAQAAWEGLVGANKVRQDLAPRPDDRARSLREASNACRVAASQVRSAAQAERENETLLPAGASNHSAAVFALRDADARLLEELAGLAAEPALVAEPAEAGLVRAAFLKLWEIRRGCTEPAVQAAESATSVPDAKLRKQLLDLASACAEEAVGRLEQEAPAISDSRGAGQDACRAFLKAQGLEAEFATGATEAARLAEGRAAARTLAHDLLNAKNAMQVEALRGRLSELAGRMAQGKALESALPAEHVAALEHIAFQMGALAQAEAELARKLQGIGRSDEAVKTSYMEVAKAAPRETLALAEALAAAREAAKVLGPEIEKAFATGLAAAKDAQPLAEAFSKDPSLKNGTAYSKALAECGKLDETERSLSRALENQKRREAEREALEAFWPRWQAFAAGLADVKLRYDQESAARIAAYDHCLAVAQAAFDPILKHVEAGTLVPYFSKDTDSEWFWTKHGTRFHGLWYDQILKTGTYNYRERHPASMTPDEILIGFVKEYWGKRFFGNPWRQSYPAFVNLLEGRRYFTFDEQDHYLSFAEHWKGLIKGLETVTQYRPFGLEDAVAHAERAIAKAEKTKPADVPKLKKYKEDLVRAAKEIEAAADAALPTNTVTYYTESRRRWAKEMDGLLASLTPLANELGRHAKVTGWDPPSLLPSQRPATQRGTPSAPQLPSSLAAAGTLSALLLNEVRGIQLYDLLAGEKDPNADLQRAKQILGTIPPDRAFDYAAKLAAAAGLIQEDIVNYLGETKDSSTTPAATGDVRRRIGRDRGEPDFAEILAGAVHRRFLEIGDDKTLGRQFERWEKVVSAWNALVPRYVQAAGRNATAEENGKVRRGFATELERIADDLLPILNALSRRAAAAGFSPPKLDPTDIKKRRIPAPTPKDDVQTVALCLHALDAELNGVWMYDLLGGAKDPNFDAAAAKAKLAEKPDAAALEYAGQLVNAVSRTLAALKGQLERRGGQGEALKRLHADCAKLAAAGHAWAELRTREPAIRAAVEASGSGGQFLQADFFDTQERVRRALALAAADAVLLRGAKLPAESTGTLGALCGPALPKLLGEAEAALRSGNVEQAVARAASLEKELAGHASAVRSGIETLRAGGSVSGGKAAHSALQWAAARELLFVANLSGDAEPLLAEQACALLLASGMLERATVYCVDGLGGTWAQKAGDARRTQLAGLLAIPEPAQASPAAGSQLEVLERLTVRPEGRNPFASDYGKLPPALARTLEHAALERHPPEAEAVLVRYLHGLRNPPQVQSRPPSVEQPKETRE